MIFMWTSSLINTSAIIIFIFPREETEASFARPSVNRVRIWMLDSPHLPLCGQSEAEWVSRPGYRRCFHNSWLNPGMVTRHSLSLFLTTVWF